MTNDLRGVPAEEGAIPPSSHGRGTRKLDRPAISTRLQPPVLAGTLSNKTRRQQIDYVQAILIGVCAEYGIGVEEILGDRRDQPVVIARWEAVRRAYEGTGLSTTELGRVFNRDHTSILYILGKVKKERVYTRKQRVVKPKLIPAVGNGETAPGLADLKPDQCHWPLGGPNDRAERFCGAHAVGGKPYCAFHCTKAYLKPSKEKGERFHIGKFADRPNAT